MRNMTTRLTHLFCCFCLSLCVLFASAQPNVVYNSIATGLNQPLEVVNAGDNSGRLFILEKEGVIKIWDGSAILGTAFLDISGIVSSGGERGLLSLAFHPDYETNDKFYIYYTVETSPDSGNIIIAQYTVSGNPNIANTTETILDTIRKPGTPPFSNHNGGHLQFRNEGGVNWLYYATGDGGSGGDPFDHAQNPGTKLGKMRRINVDAVTPTGENWAMGLRNPFRWSFDRANGNMWIGDVGQGTREEVSFLSAGASSGANFGWDCYEGTVDIKAGCDLPSRVIPVFEYDNPTVPDDPAAVTGGYVYRGSDYPSLAGYYIVADFYSGQMWLLNSSDGSEASTQTLATGIAAFGEDEDGELYAVSLTSGTLFKISAPFPLPVTLKIFTVKSLNGFNEVSWTTATEQNTKHFNIEFSYDGRNFQQAGTVVASRISSGSRYSYRHNISAGTKLFYRLQMVDDDGHAKYSPIVAVYPGDKKFEVKLYPTVIKNRRLQITASGPVKAFQIYNAAGTKVFEKNTGNVQGYFTIDLPYLSKGEYWVKIIAENNVITKPVFIQ